MHFISSLCSWIHRHLPLRHRLPRQASLVAGVFANRRHGQRRRVSKRVRPLSLGMASRGRSRTWVTYATSMLGAAVLTLSGGDFFVAATGPATAAARDMYWNNGTGNWSWNTTFANWATTSGGGTPTTWIDTPPDSAIFEGTAGTVTILPTTGVRANKVTFNTTGFNIAGNQLGLYYNSATATDPEITLVAPTSSPLTATVSGDLFFSFPDRINWITFDGSNAYSRLNVAKLAGNAVTVGLYFEGANGHTSGLNVTDQAVRAFAGTISIVNDMPTGNNAQIIVNQDASKDSLSQISIEFWQGTGILQLGNGGINQRVNVLRLDSTVGGTGFVQSDNATSTLRVGRDAPAQTSGDFDGVLRNGFGVNPNLSFEKDGIGFTQRLSGTASSYTGSTSILKGRLEVAKLANGGANSSIGASTNAASNLVLGGGATLAYLGEGDSSDRGFTIDDDDVIGVRIDSSGTGALDLTNTAAPVFASAAPITLTLGGTNTASNTLAAAIPDNGASAVTLVKDGGGTWVLSGSNTYTGTTTVSSGRLAVNGSLGNTAVTVAGGGTLGGSGSIAGTVSVANGATLAPGNSIESLAAGATSFSSGSTFAYEVDSSVALAAGADLLTVAGNLSIASGTLLSFTDIASSPTAFADGTVFALIDYAGTWDGGLFTYSGSALADGDTFSVGSQDWVIDYDSATGGSNFTADYLGSGSFVTVTAVPEPSTLALAGFGILGAVACQIRRRKKLAA